MHMFRNKVENILAYFLSAGCFLTTIVVVTLNLNEPVNAPKLVVLGATAGGALFFAVQYRNSLAKLMRFKSLLLAVCLFVLLAGISIFFSESSVATGFYGVFGRNTGFLAYLSFSLIFLGSTFLYSSDLIKIVLKGLFYAGIFNSIYFILTRFGIELFSWNNPNHIVLGTFGNSNFTGAFMGIFIVFCSAHLVDQRTSLKSKILYLSLILVSLYEVKLSHAVQGLVVTCIGWAIIIFFFIRSKYDSRAMLFSYLTLVGLFGFAAIAGALEKGPLVKLIYKSSISFRGEYWYAGWHMGITHPFFGVGMDSYGIWYRRMRAASALISPGAETTSDAAHNVFMDIFSSGGFPLLISYLLINALILMHIWRGLKVFKKFDLVFVALTSTWICYLAQSIISINQIGLAIWGWVLGGLLIGYVNSNVNPEHEVSSKNSKNPQQKGRVAAKQQKSVSISLLLIGVIIGGVISSPPVIADSKWFSTLRKLDPTQIERNSKVWPLEAIRLMNASTIYTSHKVPTRGLKIALYTVEKFPNNFFAWRVLSETPGATDAEKVKAKSEMHRLDPLNPAFK